MVLKKICYLFGLLLLQAFICVSCQSPSTVETNEVSTGIGVSTTYQEQFRPQFHFSPESMWMNDPNGMVYYQGEYHLFYQHYPDDNVWGPMHWGHAISTDLVHWEHLPIALYPDELGYIFSGSAVVDWQNTSGFGTQENPPLVAIYTYHNPVGAEENKNDFQYQAIAYSLDKGRNWTKYAQNPVVPNPGIKDFRDPKVIWHEASRKWVMVFAAFDHVKLYTSPNLKEWTWVSDFGLDQGSHGGVWECPDLFPLNSPAGEEKWVLIVSLVDGAPNGGSGTQYFIGQFDGETFVNDNSANDVLWLDYGRDNYAGVTWSDIPEDDGRRIFIGWMSNWRYAQQVPTYRWRSAMTLPRELRLENTPPGIRLVSLPVDEVKVLYGESQLIPDQILSKGQPLGLETSFDNSLSLIELTVTPDEGAEFIVELGNSLGQKVQVAYDTEQKRYSVDRTVSGKTDFSEEFSGIHYAPRISKDRTVNLKIYLDHSSLEVFADNGEVVLTELIFPAPEYDQISLYSHDEATQIQRGKITELRSIW